MEGLLTRLEAQFLVRMTSCGCGIIKIIHCIVLLLSPSDQKTCTTPVRLSFTSALDEMGTRIGDLEKNVAELMTQAGMEEQAISK